MLFSFLWCLNWIICNLCLLLPWDPCNSRGGRYLQVLWWGDRHPQSYSAGCCGGRRGPVPCSAAGASVASVAGAQSCPVPLVFRARPACTAPALALLPVPRHPSLLSLALRAPFSCCHSHSAQADLSSPRAPTLPSVPPRELHANSRSGGCGCAWALRSSLEDVSQLTAWVNSWLRLLVFLRPVCIWHLQLSGCISGQAAYGRGWDYVAVYMCVGFLMLGLHVKLHCGRY